VDDEPGNVELFVLHFGEDFVVHTAGSGEAGLALLEREDVGLVVTDERMPHMSGIELLERVAACWPDSVRMIISAYGDAHRLLMAINRGHAHEYVLKPWDADDLRRRLDWCLEMVDRRRRLAAQVELAGRLSEDTQRAYGCGRVVGEEGGLREALEAARRAARSDATVLLSGETGTGKELVAREIHRASRRVAGPFIAVNCAALAEGVLESELFGHEQGAFTGASRTHRGRFELARGGTIFLDEIGDMSPRVQMALLRVLQERELQRVGGTKTIGIDVRVVAATHRDLESEVADGRFRPDLFYRLNVVPIQLPALRQRPEDIEPLVRHFVAKHSAPGRPPPVVDAEAIEALRRYAWPGNVRELENLVQRALVLAPGDEITLDDFCLRLQLPRTESPRDEARRREEEQLREMLVRHGGNLARTARELGVPRTTLVSRVKKLGWL
jgi:DNA-binding NtrC family response regulator